MSTLNNTALTEFTSKHVQFCLGVKTLVDGDCSKDSLNSLLEELCDQSEAIHMRLVTEII